VIGAGTFSSAFLNQARRVAGMQIVSVADLDAEKARGFVSQPGGQKRPSVSFLPHRASMIGAARGKMMVTDNADHLIKADLEVIVEATGMTEAGTYQTPMDSSGSRETRSHG